MKTNNFIVYLEQDEDGVYIGSIPSIPSCYAQGATQEELLKNLKEVLILCLRNVDKAYLKTTKFIGIQDLELSHA